jgi:hypothetical protein
MSIGNVAIPGIGALQPLGYSPFAAAPTPAFIRSAPVLFNGTEMETPTLKTIVVGVPGQIIIPICLFVHTVQNTKAGGWNTSRAVLCRYLGSSVDLTDVSNTAIPSTAVEKINWLQPLTSTVFSGSVMGPLTFDPAGKDVVAGGNGALSYLGVLPNIYTMTILLDYFLAPAAV